MSTPECETGLVRSERTAARAKDSDAVGISSPPLVSIVTPSYNQGKFIRQTIESVLGQDYTNIEYWVVDGGSADETLSVLKEYEHESRFHWISEKDEGQSDAINKGLARCRGELFSWLCSDDVLLPGAVRHVVGAWMSSPRPSVIYGWGRLVNQGGEDLGYCPNQSSAICLEKLLRFEAIPVQPATFAPTEWVRTVGGVNASLHFAMDLDLWTKLVQIIPFRHVAQDLALCRLHARSKTVSLSAHFIDEVRRVLLSASHERVLSRAQAESYSHLYAARVFLTPGLWDMRRALSELATSARADISVVPLALLVLVKGLARGAVGDRWWSKARFVHARFR